MTNLHRSPDEIALEQGFKLAYHDIDGKRYYALKDWIEGTVETKRAHGFWTDLKRRAEKYGVDFNSRCLKLPYFTNDRKCYQVYHADAETLEAVSAFFDKHRRARIKRGYDEVGCFHPLVSAALASDHWQTQHHVKLESGRIIDFVAIKRGQVMTVECKPDFAKSFYIGLGQAIAYALEYGQGAIPALATFSHSITPYISTICERANVRLIAIEGDSRE